MRLPVTALLIAFTLAAVALLPAEMNRPVLGYGATDALTALLIAAFLGLTARI